MKAAKAIGSGAAVLAVAAILVFMLLAHGDEQVSGVVLTDRPVTDMEMLDGIKSSKGAKLNGYDGALYATATTEFGKYVYTDIAPVPAGQPLYANIYFIAVPQGMEFRAVWVRDGSSVKEETKAITSDKREAVSYELADVRPGTYTFEIYYRDKQLYSQAFTVE